MKKSIFIFSFVIALTVSCKNNSSEKENNVTTIDSAAIVANKEAIDDSLSYVECINKQAQFSNIVYADYETQPVYAQKGKDAADDPAIWVNKKNPQKSLIIGTNKKHGLHLYDLKGTELQFIKIGKINNADVAYNFSYNNEKIDIVAGTNRTNNTVVVYKINNEALLLDTVPICTINSKLTDIYGFCMLHNPKNNTYFAILNNTGGQLEQWELKSTEKGIEPILTYEFKVNSQCEGMVADNESNTLYVGVEGEGIFKFTYSEAGISQGEMLNQSSQKTNTNITYDIEGLAIYKHKNKKYLIASIQGSFSYAIFDLDKNAYVSSFVIKESENIDGVEETDGLDISSQSFGTEFPDGIFVVQDGFNSENNEKLPQNFKIVSASKIIPFFN